MPAQSYTLRTMLDDDRLRGAPGLAAAITMDVARVDALKAALADASAADALRSSLAKALAAATPIEKMGRSVAELGERLSAARTSAAELARRHGTALSVLGESAAAAAGKIAAGGHDVVAAERRTARQRIAAGAEVTAALDAEIAARGAARREELADERRTGEARLRIAADEGRRMASSPARHLLHGVALPAWAAARIAGDELRVAGRPAGVVRGPGGPREDRVLARLSAGEFVVNAGATARHRAVLEAINRNGILPRFADGGIVAPRRNASDAVSYEAPNTDGNALHRNDEVPAASTPAGRAVAAWGEAHDVRGRIEAAGDRADAIGTSLASGHSADDFLHYEAAHLPHSRAGLATALAAEPMVFGLRAFDGFARAVQWSNDFQTGKFGDPADPKTMARATPGALDAASTLAFPGLFGSLERATLAGAERATLGGAVKAAGAKSATLGTAGAERLAAQGPGLQKAGEGATLASSNTSVYNHPIMAQRPFETDYPLKVSVDGSGTLSRDINGRDIPPGAVVIGRHVENGPDVGLRPDQIYAVGRSNGATYQRVPGRDIGGDAGRIVLGRSAETGAPEVRIAINNSLPAATQDIVAAHETAHLINELAGGIPTKGLSSELKKIYNSGNNGQRNVSGTDARANAPAVTPKSFRYKGEDIEHEYMAEAIRAYMVNPNYMKSVAPKTAAAIRAAVNNNPRLKGTVHFNAGGLPIFPAAPQDGPAIPPLTPAEIVRRDADNRPALRPSEVPGPTPYGALRRTPPLSSYFGLRGPTLDGMSPISGTGFVTPPYADKSSRSLAPHQRAVLPNKPAAVLAPASIPPEASRKGFANLMHGQYGAPGENLTTITTPGGRKVTVHGEAADSFRGFLGDLERSGYSIDSLGGYASRGMRGNPRRISQHAYGNAIDINPDRNPFHTSITDLPPNVSDMAAKWGLSWGGDWSERSRDPMHFEWTGARPWENKQGPAATAQNKPLVMPFGLTGTALEAMDRARAAKVLSLGEDRITRASQAERDAERAVMPRRPSPSMPERHAAGIDFDHSGIDAAIAKVDTLDAKLRGLRSTASVDINHTHTHRSEAGPVSQPGAVRTSLNGRFGSDGRTWG